MSSQKRVDRSTSATICPLPFMHTYVTANGSAVACCEAQETRLSEPGDFAGNGWNSHSYRALRKQLVNGERPEVCSKCWKNEDIGVVSNRMDSWHHYLNGRWGEKPLIVDEEGRVPSTPTFFELKTSNLCNLKCRMCHPASSQRISEDREIVEQFRQLDWPEKIISSGETVHALLDSEEFLSGLKVVQFSGGEPLMSMEQVEFVKRLLNLELENLELRYSTNLTMLTYKGLNYPELWKRFKKVNLKISADGVGAVYDYIRVGGSFEVLDRNLQKLLDFDLPNLQLNLGFTTQAYNVFQLPEVFEHFQKYMDLEAISYPLLHTPEMMSLRALPPEIRQKVLRKFASFPYEFHHVVQALEGLDHDPFLWDQLTSYTKQMEKKYEIEDGFESIMMNSLEGY